MSFPVSFIADYLINNGHCRLINVRRIFVAMGVIGPGLSFVWLAFIGLVMDQFKFHSFSCYHKVKDIIPLRRCDSLFRALRNRSITT